MTNEIMYKLLKAIEKDPKTNQRQLSAELMFALEESTFLLTNC